MFSFLPLSKHTTAQDTDCVGMVVLVPYDCSPNEAWKTAHATQPTNKGAMHSGTSVGIYTKNKNFARFGIKSYAQPVLVNNYYFSFVIYLHLHVHFGIKLYAHLAYSSLFGA